MTLKMLLKWALENDISLDYHLVVGEQHDHTVLNKVEFNHHDKVLILGDNKIVETKILDFIMQVKCNRINAIIYLQNNNWNLPLAIVAYQRENR